MPCICSYLQGGHAKAVYLLRGVRIKFHERKGDTVTFADFAVTYLIPAGIVLLIVLGLMRYFAVRGTASETNFKEYKEKAEQLGSAARKGAEDETKALFDEFRRKENSL